MDQNNKYTYMYINRLDDKAIFVGHVQYYYYYITECCRTYCSAKQFINVVYIYECNTYTLEENKIYI